MMMWVIFSNGSLEKVRARSLEALIKSGEIKAFRCSEGWIEVRRGRMAGNFQEFLRGISRTAL